MQKYIILQSNLFQSWLWIIMSYDKTTKSKIQSFLIKRKNNIFRFKSKPSKHLLGHRYHSVVVGLLNNWSQVTTSFDYYSSFDYITRYWPSFLLQFNNHTPQMKTNKLTSYQSLSQFALNYVCVHSVMLEFWEKVASSK